MKSLFIAIALLAVFSAAPFATAGTIASYRKSPVSTGAAYSSTRASCTGCGQAGGYSIAMVPRFQFSCQKGYYKVLGMFSTTWYGIKKDLLTGKTEKSECFYGCDRDSGKCMAGSHFKWKCEGGFFRRNTRSVKINLNSGKTVEEIKCLYGCDSASGRCKTVK